MVDTIKFSQMTDGGDLANNEKTPGLLAGANVLFNNPWTFLPPGSTADRPTPSATINYRLRFNTTDQLYEYYDAVLGAWTQLQESAFTQGPFVIYTADASIPDGQNLGALANGILKQTITAGVATLDIAVNGTDYYGPGFTGYFESPAGVKDINGNIVCEFMTDAVDATEWIQIFNGKPGDPAAIAVDGLAADVQLDFYSKGVGQIAFNSEATTNQYSFFSGPNYQHQTVFFMPSTAVNRTVTWQDSDGTVAWLSDVAGTVTSAQGVQNQVLVNGTFGTQETGDCIFTTPQDIGLTSTPQFSGAYFGAATGPQAAALGVVQAIAQGGANASFVAASYNNASGGAPTFWTYKSRSTTVGGFAAVQAGDELGRWEGFAADGTQFTQAGAIVLQAAGTISTGIVPGVWSFYTNNAAGALSFGMSISQTQLVTVQNLFSNTNIQSAGGITSGQTTGGGGSLTMYSPTTLLGNTQFIAANNAGNFSNILTNASTAAARTWTLPDASGTIALTSGASGIINPGLINQLAWYAAAGTTLSGLATVANSVLSTSAGGVPSLSTTLPQSLLIPNPNIGGSGLFDLNGNAMLAFGATASAVNYLQLVNAAAGGTPYFQASGASTNIGILLSAKGNVGIQAIGGVGSTVPLSLLINSTASRADFNIASLTTTRTFTFPDASGTIALTSGIPSLGNYSFSANIMTVSSGTMQFNLPNGNLLLSSSGDTLNNIVSTSATGSPGITMYRNTSTLIGAVQAGITSAGASGGSGMIYYNGISNGAHYFWTNGATFATLSPLGSTLALGNLELTAGELHIGASTGGGAQILDIFSPTASKGLFQFLAIDNVGNFTARLTHASITASRTWTLPDATGTISLNSGNTSWTPVVSFSTPGDLSVSYVTQSAFYCRVGNVVSAHFVLTCTPTFTTASGNLQISGLPFALAFPAIGECQFQASIWPVGTTSIMLQGVNGQQYFVIGVNGTAAATAYLTTTQCTSGAALNITGSITYLAS